MSPRPNPILAALALVASCSAPPERAFVGGAIWTGDPAQPWATALAVRDGRLSAVGSDTEVRAMCAGSTEIVELDGRFVCPGFIDAHLHFLVPDQVELEESNELAEIQASVADYARAHPSAEWIVGRGWGYGSFPGNAPHRAQLDAVMSDRPVLLYERDGHMALANSRALELAGVDRASADPEHGRIVRDARGEPTGELHESAVGLVARLVPEHDVEDLYATFLSLQDRAASYGLTSVHNASYDPEVLPLLERAIGTDGLKLRFYWVVPFVAEASEADFAEWRALQERFPPELVRFGGAKGMLDGVVDAQTAAMFEPFTTGQNGIAMWEQEELDRTAARYDGAGFQILLHAIGDRAIAMALDAYESVQRENGARDRRPRIEHIEVPRLADLPRFRELGVIASTQALFAEPDQTTLVNYSPLLGPERAARANAFKLFDDAGAVQAFGSDWPVFSMEVLRGIYCAATRQTPEGTPPGGYFPEHRIPVEAALRHFTRDAAYASFEEHEKGTLEVGKRADFVVLSENILSVPPERILTTRVVRTVMDGRDTHLESFHP